MFLKEYLTVKKLAVLALGLSVLGMSCGSMGCVATHTNNGVDISVAGGALGYEFASTDFVATAKLDPAALAERVVDDTFKVIGNIVKNVRSLFTPKAGS